MKPFAQQIEQGTRASSGTATSVPLILIAIVVLREQAKNASTALIQKIKRSSYYSILVIYDFRDHADKILALGRRERFEHPSANVAICRHNGVGARLAVRRQPQRHGPAISFWAVSLQKARLARRSVAEEIVVFGTARKRAMSVGPHPG